MQLFCIKGRGLSSECAGDSSSAGAKVQEFLEWAAPLRQRRRPGSQSHGGSDGHTQLRCYGGIPRRKELSVQEKLDSRASPASRLGPYADSSALLYEFQQRPGGSEKGQQ